MGKVLFISLLLIMTLSFPDADIHWDFMLSSNNRGNDVVQGVTILNDEEQAVCAHVCNNVYPNANGHF